MKKISRTIAVILVLVMLACSFTSCLSYVYRSSSVPLRILYAVVDIMFLPISLLALLIYVIINDASSDMESQIYLASTDYNMFSEYYSLVDKIYSLPEEELASLKQIVNSIPVTERVSSIERISSLSETERASLVSAYNSLPETEITSSLERISALSDTERVSLLQEFNGLSEEELASLIEQLRAMHNNEYIAAADTRERMYAGLALQY